MRRMFSFAVTLCLGAIVGIELPAAELPHPGQAKRLSGDQAKALILADFIRFDPHYSENRQRLGDRLNGLGQQLAKLQAAGNEMECSNEIYSEAQWLIHYTADWPRLERRLADLAKSLDQPDQDFATHQSSEAGLWGACYEEPFFKVEATVLALMELAEMGQAPEFAVHLPHPFDTHANAVAHFFGLLVSDIAHTGVDHRGELGSISTVASLSYFKDYIQDYFDTKVVGLPRNEGGPGAQTQSFRDEFRGYVQDWQDPESGYWGPWYLSEGRPYKTNDLSFTFHIVSYLRGQVDHWPEIIETTLAIKNEPYPFGWKHEGDLTNHNNYDAAKVFRYGWLHMSSEQRRHAADTMTYMLHWTLTSSLQPSGSFKTIPTFFSSVAADFYFGVLFLRTIGLWDNPETRFWTHQDFPEAGAICARIKERLVAMGLKSHESKDALAALRHSC
jgi:hypothetical protein